MAAKNSVKIYVPDSFYHIYNRGVEKRKIFLDEQDFSVFLSYLQTYLSPKDVHYLQTMLASDDSSARQKDEAIKMLRLKNYYSQVQLVCYALMSNHFHLLVRQNDLVLNNFMNSLGTRYAVYFNHKYKRQGVLFQDVYKAVLVETVEQLLHLSRYIHVNPIKAQGLPIHRWREASFPSSLPEYLGVRQTSWISKEFITDYFSKTNNHGTYEEFMGLTPDFDLIAAVAIDLDVD